MACARQSFHYISSSNINKKKCTLGLYLTFNSYSFWNMLYVTPIYPNREANDARNEAVSTPLRVTRTSFSSPPSFNQGLCKYIDLGFSYACTRVRCQAGAEEGNTLRFMNYFPVCVLRRAANNGLFRWRHAPCVIREFSKLYG